MTAGRAVDGVRVRQTVFSDAPDVLADIYQESANMAVWRRQPEAFVTEECRQALTERRFTGSSTALSSMQLQHLDEAIPELVPYPHLRADVQSLAEMFICLFGLQAVGLRMTPLAKAMCPRFHVDRVPCRLVTTYLGKGTEWLPHHRVDRSKLGAGNGGLSDAESGLYSDPDAVQTLAHAHVALLKGELWEGNENAGLVHRSPAIGPGEQRLLVTMDCM